MQFPFNSDYFKTVKFLRLFKFNIKKNLVFPRFLILFVTLL
nr:MAG TPA: hypothetical protein [Caudoviricetes sp.]